MTIHGLNRQNEIRVGVRDFYSRIENREVETWMEFQNFIVPEQGLAVAEVGRIAHHLPLLSNT